MARYSLNVSEICEQITGLNYNDIGGNPFDAVDTICNAAAPLLVSDRYDLLDNGDDRNTLIRMLLEHYWEYEVCALTPADFTVRLNRKLNEIAPLYNQRYESTKLEFPWDQDVDYTEDGGHSNQGTLADSTASTDINSGDDITKHNKTNISAYDEGTAGATKRGMRTNWDYNNDTPQNSISGITDQDYLTNYSKHTEQMADATTSTSGQYITPKVVADAPNVPQISGTGGDTSAGRVSSVSQSKDGGDDTLTHGHVIDRTGALDRATTDDGVYDKHVYGKTNGGKNYSEYMMLYREQMINIYTEIIEELHELFFMIY